MKDQNATQQTQVVSFYFAWLVAMLYALPHAQAQTQNWCVPPDPDYCVSRVCGVGEGDCDPGQCASGLLCVNDVGAQYGLPAHYDVCEIRRAGTPDPDYCVHNTCGIGEGDCDPGQCDEGVCVNDVGAQYGLPAHYDVCEAERDTTPEPLTRGKMYWTSNGRIQRANLDGTQVETLLTDSSEKAPEDYSKLALDLTPGKIYWTNNRGIYRANLNGSQIETLVLGDDTDSFALDPVGGKMYWTDGGTSTILWANLDGTQIETFLPADPLLPGIDRPSLVLDLAGGKLYWIDTDGARRMQRANLDGTRVETLFTDSTTASNQSYWGVDVFALDLAKGKFYWIDGSLYRANLDDGSHVEELVPNTGDGTGLALDLAGGKMYWTTWNVPRSLDGLYRANLDGSQVEALVTGLDSPHGLVLVLE